jgi:hypothetical protein
MNSPTKALVFAFRKPRFPLICDLDGDLFAAESAAALRRLLGRAQLPDEKKMRFVDTRGEGWMFLQNEMVFAPKFALRTWRKSEIINLFNRSRVANERGWHYSERSLGNRRLDVIVCEIAALLKKKTGKYHG